MLCGRTPSRSVATHTYSHHASAISVLPTNIDTSSADYKENARQMGEVMARMRDLHQKIEESGPPKSREKHIARGKMLPREYVIEMRTARADVTNVIVGSQRS